ncbi:hypothetical protein [Alkalicoccobacillus porphyridii]|uniref:Uncharacterized protein n=1 Tax=Alkalicoccobacillus porphyridii TaxID=2597270 RepID=A0A554A2J6_9BACI|nr:hypothetical protein [Alkalicoccobacillus porphyridii]TSB47912.1 hypothetical protein FN960_05240 [Alkalicoccobacillus porphyridii]
MTRQTRRIFVFLGSFIILMGLFLVASKIYFNSKEIRLASERCIEAGGVVNLEQSQFNLNYTFSCELES